jgi:hypothetical protein
MLKIFTVQKKQESTMEEKNLSTLFNLMGVGKILSFAVSLLTFFQMYQFEHRDYSHILCHKYAGNSLAKITNLQIHNSNGQLTTPLIHCYFMSLTRGLGHITKTIAT